MEKFVAAVETFLRQEFPAFEVLRNGSDIELQYGSLRYSLSIAPDAEASGADPEAYLKALKLRDELCRAEGLPLLLSAHGIRLRSAN